MRRGILIQSVLYGIMFCLVSLISGCDKAPRGAPSTGEHQPVDKPTTRMSFDQLFEVNGDTVTPKQIIRIGPTTMTPEVPFESTVMIIDNAPFSQYIGREAEVRKSGLVYEIVQFD